MGLTSLPAELGLSSLQLRSANNDRELPERIVDLLHRNAERIILFTNGLHDISRELLETTIADYRFSDLPLTLFDNGGIRIDLYHWDSRTIGVHSHSFVGAFMIINGESVNITYKHVDVLDLGDGVERGKLVPTRAYLMQSGDISPIYSYDDFIHNNWHFRIPAKTLVIRCEAREAFRSLSRRYLTSGLSFPSSIVPDLEKTLRYLTYCKAADIQLAQRFLTNNLSSFSKAEWLWLSYFLAKQFPDLILPKTFLDPVFGRDVELFVQALEDLSYTDQLAKLRSLLGPDPDLSFILSLITFKLSASTVFDLLKQKYPGAAPSHSIEVLLVKFGKLVSISDGPRYEGHIAPDQRFSGFSNAARNMWNSQLVGAFVRGLFEGG